MTKFDNGTDAERAIINQHINEIMGIFLSRFERGMQHLSEYVKLHSILCNIYDIDLMSLDMTQIEVVKFRIYYTGIYGRYVYVDLKVKDCKFMISLNYPLGGLNIGPSVIKDNGLNPLVTFFDRKYKKKKKISLSMTDTFLDVSVKHYVEYFTNLVKPIEYLKHVKDSLG
jgi:hypothetical protein